SVVSGSRASRTWPLVCRRRSCRISKCSRQGSRWRVSSSSSSGGCCGVSSLPRIRRRVDRYLRPYREYHAGRLGAIQELPLAPVEGPEVKEVIDGEDLSHRPRQKDDPEHAKPAIGPRTAGEAATDEALLGIARQRHQYAPRPRHG